MKIVECTFCAIALDESDTIDGKCKSHINNIMDWIYGETN